MLKGSILSICLLYINKRLLNKENECQTDKKCLAGLGHSGFVIEVTDTWRKEALYNILHL